MTKRKIPAVCFSAAGIMILILDGQTALLGASVGLDLCLRTVIPSMFPFLFLCSVLTSLLWGEALPFLRPTAKCLGIPPGAESILAAAVLGGYPAGAQSIGDCYQKELLSRKDAEHLLTFCSNAGPAFLFGMIARQFTDTGMIWALWGIQLLSAALTALFGRNSTALPAILPSRSTSVPQLLIQTVKTMSIICGWIMLFQILAQFLSKWFLWIFPSEIQIIITGLLELSCGCSGLTQIESIPLRFLTCAVFLSFGGVCVTMQTDSVIGSLSIIPYLRGKFIQSLLSLVLSMLYLIWGWSFLAAIMLSIPIICSALKKEVDFCGNRMYNTVIIHGRNHRHAVSKKN